MGDRVTMEIIEGPNYDLEPAYGPEGRPWEHHAYTLELTYQGRTMQTPWRQGLGITDDPNAREVLDAICRDAATFDGDQIDEVTDGLPASRVIALYKQLEQQAGALRELLADDYDAAVWGENTQTEADHNDWIRAHTAAPGDDD